MEMPLAVWAPRTLDSIDPRQIGATEIWLLLPGRLPDGGLPIVYTHINAQN